MVADIPLLHPVACVGGQWLQAHSQPRRLLRNPSAWSSTLGEVPCGRNDDIQRAAGLAARAQKEWQRSPLNERIDGLLAWAVQLEARQEEFARLMALEIGKPLAEGTREVRRAAENLRVTAAVARQGWDKAVPVHGDISYRQCPIGVIGMITPWNNPVAIPVGKIAPALAFGNGTVWKPAIQAPQTSILLMQTLIASGFRNDIVSIVFGDRETARLLIAQQTIDAISLTGSTRTGHIAAKLCAAQLKPLQAELGGNNAAIVMPDCDLGEAARQLAVGAFGFSGQRCTANRRIIVHNNIRAEFKAALVEAVDSLTIGQPQESITQIGPLISRTAQRRIMRDIASAIASGAGLLSGGTIPQHLRHGCWYRPTVLETTDPGSAIVQEESFGPVAVIQPADDIEEALRLCNGVRHGLIASLYSQDDRHIKYFRAEAEAGNIKLNRPTADIEVSAPFCGWKCSGLGQGEHGPADVRFYTRMQTVYD